MDINNLLKKMKRVCLHFLLARKTFLQSFLMSRVVKGEIFIELLRLPCLLEFLSASYYNFMPFHIKNCFELPLLLLVDGKTLHP